MSNQNNGGPAFPSHGSMGEVVQEGMDLRDYFAAKVIAECLVTCSTKQRAAEEAYEIADAMLKARQA